MCGILSLFVFPFLFGPLAVIFGVIGLHKAKRSGRAGSGMGVAGLVLGFIGIVGGFLVVTGAIGNGTNNR